MANIKVTKPFRLDGILQKPGESITVDSEKAKYIIEQGWAEGSKPKAKKKKK